MSERKTVFGICYGSYSDWSVALLCETREQAEAAIKEMEPERGSEPYEIEEFDFYPSGSGPGVHTIYEANGLEGTMDVRVKNWQQFGPAPARPEVRQDPWHGNRGSPHPIFVEARCRDRAAAVKAVKDRLAALKVSGDWLPPPQRDLDLLRISLK